MSLNKSSSIIIVLLLLVMLWAAYYMVAGSFKQSMVQHAAITEQSKGSLTKLENSIASLDESIGKPINKPVKVLVVDSQVPVATAVVPADTRNELEKTSMERELKALYARLESSDKSQAQLVEALQGRLAKADVAQDSLRAQLLQSQGQNEELHLQNVKLNSQLVEVTGQLKAKEEAAELSSQARALVENKETVLLKGELVLQQKKLDKINALYDDLKDKLKDFAAIIARKDAALTQKDKEIENLRLQLNFVALKFQNLEKSLSQSEKNQVVLSQKLAQMKELNSTIQDYIAQADSYVAEQSVKGDIAQINEITSSVASNASIEPQSDDGARAKELKKQVEVILQPQQ